MSSEQPPRPIAEVAADLGVQPRHLVPYGDDKAKIRWPQGTTVARPGAWCWSPPSRRRARARARPPHRWAWPRAWPSIGESVCLALREPSLGPTFGKKGGATGGGKLGGDPHRIDINHALHR